MRGVTVLEYMNELTNKFQLTRLMRGVTQIRIKSFVISTVFQLTRLMRGVTAFTVVVVDDVCDFNSHASCEA